MTAALPRRAWVEQIMGLPVSVHLRGPDAAGPDAEAAVAGVFADLRRADAAFSPYLDGSDLSRWERGEVPPTPALQTVIALCDEARERTGGWFDPRGLPDPRTGRPRYDPSGLVKGWAVEQAAARLAGLDGLGWCVNAGGDVLVHAPSGHPPWRIGVENPDAARVANVVTRATGAVATSGRAHRGDHIVDPHSGVAATGVRSVTVTGPDLLWADVYATAAVARGPWAMDWLEGLEGYEALMVTASGLVRVSEGWPAA